MANKSINDHKFFAGSGSPKFPMGNHIKHETPVEGAGAIHDYPCFSEDIAATQKSCVSMMKKHSQKKDHRN